MLIKTSDLKSIKPFLNKVRLAQPNSHKGQNGKALIIGGSSLFHSASIWAAEVASHFVDIVHYSSTNENNEIFLALKKKFRNGIVVPRKDLLDYVEEDDVVLIGPGMVRGEKFKISNLKFQISGFSDILKIKDEGLYTYYLTKYLLENYPKKKFVIDAGALQMMESEWLLNLKTKAIITPHQGEFTRLFGQSINQFSLSEKEVVVREQAKKYSCVILLKTIEDIISDGVKNYIIQGGNAGLTKGGTGDVLAGLSTGFYAKNPTIDSCVLASFILKTIADKLFLQKGYWYNIEDIVDYIPLILKNLIFAK